MASPRYRFGAHDCRRRLRGEMDEFVQVLLERGRLHVIRKSAKPSVAPGGVDGIAPRMTQSAKPWQMLINDSRVLQTAGQIFLVELRVVPRTRDGSDIHQLPDAVRVQNTDELIDRMRGMAD